MEICTIVHHGVLPVSIWFLCVYYSEEQVLHYIFFKLGTHTLYYAYIYKIVWLCSPYKNLFPGVFILKVVLRELESVYPVIIYYALLGRTAILFLVCTTIVLRSCLNLQLPLCIWLLAVRHLLLWTHGDEATS